MLFLRTWNAEMLWPVYTGQISSLYWQVLGIRLFVEKTEARQCDIHHDPKCVLTLTHAVLVNSSSLNKIINTPGSAFWTNTHFEFQVYYNMALNSVNIFKQYILPTVGI